ncbi:MAG: hypothetical protein HYY76_18010 [Acidobacteria bacterium]|nr:hypothetical protein [Acidobacteriota bacterium]
MPRGLLRVRGTIDVDLFTDGSLGYWPEEIVFREKPSTLRGPDGKIPRW